MLLTCPTCQSGLQVPDGTTAHVRCPTCRTVFPPSAGVAPPPAAAPAAPQPAPASRTNLPPAKPSAVRKPPADEDRPRPRERPPRREDDEDEDRPRKRRRDDHDEDEDRPRAPRRSRDEDDEDRPPRKGGRDGRPEEPEEDAEERRGRRKRRDEDEKLTPEERRAQANEFARGMWGARLVYFSFGLYAISLLITMVFLVRHVLAGPYPPLASMAGGLGILNWVFGAVGLGLCLAGRRSPGHWQFGIAAVAAVLAHLILLAATVSRGESFLSAQTDKDEVTGRWGPVVTSLDSLAFYLAWVVTPDAVAAPKAMGLFFAAGVVEVVRVVLLMMTLSCLARAAGDEELAHRCTRAAGIASFGPGGLAVVSLLVVGLLAESGGEQTTFGEVLLGVLLMGVYAILAGMFVPAAVAARDTADACEAPYQSQKITFGG